MRLSDKQISAAKTAANIQDARHEHDDCIRMAYEWLDAQKTVKSFRRDDWKHMIERWCQRYISHDDVQVAALMHSNIKGKFPSLNIGRRLVLPNEQRLESIGQAKAHFYEPASWDEYSQVETRQLVK